MEFLWPRAQALGHIEDDCHPRQVDSQIAPYTLDGSHAQDGRRIEERTWAMPLHRCKHAEVDNALHQIRMHPGGVHRLLERQQLRIPPGADEPVPGGTHGLPPCHEVAWLEG
jgi:hypothetical protein